MARGVDVLPVISLVSNLTVKAAYLFFRTTKDNVALRYSHLVSNIRES